MGQADRPIADGAKLSRKRLKGRLREQKLVAFR